MAADPAAPRAVAGPGGGRAWLVWVTAVSAYVLAILYRSTLGVAGLAAADRFGISASQLATFTVLQIGLYAAMQVPVGLLLDRFGSRRLLLAGVALMTVGQVAFAVVDSYPLALASRVVAGIGDATAFVSVLRIVGAWFPAPRLPMMSQLTGQAGLVGALAATVPLTYALASWGWTMTFAALAVLGLLVLVGVTVVVVDRPHPEPPVARPRTTLREVLAAIRETHSRPGTRLGMWTHFTTLLGPLVFTLLWGFPFLVKGQGLSPTEAGSLLMVMSLGSAAIAPVIGRITGRSPIRRSRIALGVVVAIALSWALLLAWPERAPLPLLVAVLVVTSFGGPASGMAFDMARSYNPPERVGTAMGLVNVGGFTAGLLTMGAIGLVLDWRAPAGPDTYGLADFRVALSVQFVLWLIGLVQILRYRRRTLALLVAAHPDALAALRAGDLLLPGISRPADPARV